MKNIKVLMDDRPGSNSALEQEHGLSVYFEADNKAWLLDAGLTGAFARNAGLLGVDISRVDYLIISHGHSDHIGGLETFLNINQKAKVVMSSLILRQAYYSSKSGRFRNIGPDVDVLERNKNRLILLDRDRFLAPDVAVITPVTGSAPLPAGNDTLFCGSLSAGIRPDDFQHELAAVVRTPQGVVVLTGCCHNGLLNILRRASGVFDPEPIRAVIGGTHLRDGYETAEQVRAVARQVQHHYPGIRMCTGHCTGDSALQVFREEFGTRYFQFFTGADIRI